jgi:hypothetical protein
MTKSSKQTSLQDALIELPVDFVASKSWLKAASNACITTKDSTEMEPLKVCARQKKQLKTHTPLVLFLTF